MLIDGAHVPGVLPLDVPALGVDWYTANLHKWACAPRGCGFLWAARSRQAGLHPPVISWGLDKGFTAEFDWIGTRDPSPWLAAPEGLAFLEDLGLAAVRQHNHDLAWRGAEMLADRWGTTLAIDEASVGFMVTVPLPQSLGGTAADAARVRDALLFQHRIEVQVHARTAVCGRASRRRSTTTRTTSKNSRPQSPHAPALGCHLDVALSRPTYLERMAKLFVAAGFSRPGRAKARPYVNSATRSWPFRL